MSNKTWARLVGGAVAELLTIDAGLEPGTDIPAFWTDDVTALSGLAVGWIKASDGSFAAPAVDLTAIKTAQQNFLSALCAASITSGLTSSALGTPHRYGSQQADQLNLGGAMVAAAVAGASFTADITCSADNWATWSLVTHTAPQIATLFGDMRAWIDTQQAKHRTLQAEVAAATTMADVTAVVWA